MAQNPSTLAHVGDPEKPRILFVHQNYPGQFRSIALYLRDQGWDVMYATAHEHAEDMRLNVNADGLRVFGYRARREPSDKISRYLKPMEKAVVNGQAFAGGALKLRNHGYHPDIVCAHSGWGSGSFAKVAWPQARFVQYLEWWYAHPPRDAAPDLTMENPEDRHASTLCRNLPFLLDAQTADAILCPTHYQAADIPEFLGDRVKVLHDGTDCRFYAPGEVRQGAWLPEAVGPDTPVVTYATRGMEPMRGFPEFMAAWAEVQKSHPEAHAIIAGTDSVHYGPKPPEGQSYRKQALAAHDFDRDRLHFVGKLAYGDYRDLLRRSDCHTYLTRPFVLSWSLIDAMGCACPMVVSDVEPVREALPEAGQARHVDHHDVPALTAAIRAMLDDPEGARAMGQAARARALATYDADHIYPAKAAWFQSLLD